MESLFLLAFGEEKSLVAPAMTGSEAFFNKLLGHFSHRFLGIAQWFVHLSAYPQPMQHYRQLSSHVHDGSLLFIFSDSLSQLPSLSPQITVFSTRSQNVVRSLHHHRKQIPISSFADALLWFALPRVPAARS
jgi:hypothetical protein